MNDISPDTAKRPNTITIRTAKFWLTSIIVFLLLATVVGSALQLFPIILIALVLLISAISLAWAWGLESSHLQPPWIRIPLLAVSALGITVCFSIYLNDRLDSSLIARAAPSGDQGNSSSAIEQLNRLGYSHARRLFQDFDARYFGENGNPKANNHDAGPLLYWSLVYGDIGLGQDTPVTISLEKLKETYSWRKLASRTPFSDGLLPSQSFRELPDFYDNVIEGVKVSGTSEKAVLLIPSVEFLCDGKPELNLAMDSSSASRYVHHYIGKYLVELAKAGYEIRPEFVSTHEPPSSSNGSNQPQTEEKPPVIYTPAGQIKTAWNPREEIKNSESPGEKNEFVKKPIADRDSNNDLRTIQNVLRTIRNGAVSKAAYRIPYPVPTSAPYTARQWVNGPIQMWTQYLFWFGVLALVWQSVIVASVYRRYLSASGRWRWLNELRGWLRSWVSDIEKDEPGSETTIIFRRHLSIAAQMSARIDFDALKEELDQFFSANQQQWKKRSNLFDFVNFAIPLFGLLGTVAGISGAFEKAPAFIRAGGDQLAQEGAMGLLATSVSIAFFTTLVACYLSVVFFFLHKAILDTWEKASLRKLRHEIAGCVTTIRCLESLQWNRTEAFSAPVNKVSFSQITSYEIDELESQMR